MLASPKGSERIPFELMKQKQSFLASHVEAMLSGRKVQHLREKNMIHDVLGMISHSIGQVESVLDTIKSQGYKENLKLNILSEGSFSVTRYGSPKNINRIC